MPLICILTLLVIAAAILIGTAAYRPTLVVRDAESGKELVLGSISEGDAFDLDFIHSVDILPVQDHFVYKNKELYLMQTKCLSFGAGLGYMGQGTLQEKGKWSEIDNMNRRVGALPLRVGTIADHTIVYKGRKYRLSDYFTPKSLVKVGVERKRNFLWGNGK
ncbi:hypothetical protein SAMN05660649_03662 [Desulfotomaculum arcticum]|uniref:DUF1850 domain-containing protein n=1 Tax=Desulfotruncus arcticus DSM 17038 TaxID=1121424 RepID=A0A1I2WX61_9FIRM|nr:hypothetical protein SAMN05660649_03662 [Desulfotomaculum arcticum] [Desulfotruncus arcticus DSM 17038]